MSKPPVIPVLGALGLLAIGVALVAYSKPASAAEPNEADDDLDPDLAAVVDQTGGTEIVVADDVTGEVSVTTEEEALQPLPTDDPIEDAQGAKELADAVEDEPDIETEEAVEELLPEPGEPDEEESLIEEVKQEATNPPAPGPSTVPPPVQPPPVVVQQPPPVVVQQPALPPSPVVTEEEVPSDALLYQAYLLRAEHDPNWEEMGQDTTKLFQRSYGLTADGKAGPGTILKLVSTTMKNPVPIVRKWKKGTWIGSPDYKAYIAAIDALGLDSSREKGQGLSNKPITDLRTL